MEEPNLCPDSVASRVLGQSLITFLTFIFFLTQGPHHINCQSIFETLPYVSKVQRESVRSIRNSILIANPC